MAHHVGRTIPQPFVTAPLRVLLVGADPGAAAALGESGGFEHEPEVVSAVGVAEALRVLASEMIHAVVVDLQLDGTAKKSRLRRLVAAADDRPVAALIDEHQVVDTTEALETGAVGFYYRDQLDADLIQRICKIALGRWLRASDRTSDKEAAVEGLPIARASPLVLRSVGRDLTGSPLLGRRHPRGRRVAAS